MSDSVEQRLSELEDTVESLAEECQRKDERINELEAELEQRPPLRMEREYDDETPGVVLAEDLYIGDWAIGKSIKKRVHEDDHFELEERVCNLENDAVTETVDVNRDELLPIQRYTIDRQSGDHDLRGNKLRATYVFEEFRKHAVSEGGNLKLPSSQVKNIHREHDLDDNPNTIRRTMRMVAKHSAKLPDGEREPNKDENLIDFVEASSKNVLVANKKQWDETMDQSQTDTESEPKRDEFDEEAAAEMDELTQAEPVATDGGEDTTQEVS